jgi:hypothetical protein
VELTITLVFSDAFLNFRANTIIKEDDIALEEFLQFLSNGFERVFLRALTIWTAEMGHQGDCFGLVVDTVFDGRQSSDNALIVCDFVGRSFLLGDLVAGQLPCWLW